MASNPSDGEDEPCCYSNFPGTVCPSSQERAAVGLREQGGEEESVDPRCALETPPPLLTTLALGAWGRAEVCVAQFRQGEVVHPE